MTITVLLDVTPYVLTDIYQCFGGKYRLHLQRRKVKKVKISLLQTVEAHRVARG
jgi:hypothetical protein